MQNNQLKTSAGLHQLSERFAERLERRHFFCLQTAQPSQIKLQRIELYCQQHGFIFNRSTINMIRNSLAAMMTSAFDHAIEQKSPTVQLKKHIDIQLQLTHVNALPSRTERGIFLIIELGNQTEDLRYSLVSLLGKQTPSYEILHSRGYHLPESIRKSPGTVLLDQLATGLKDFLDEMPFQEQLPQSLQLGLLVQFPIKQNELNHAEILSWNERFHCPDLLQRDIIGPLQQSIEYTVRHPQITVTACVQDSVAALISVAFDYPNTFISLLFKQTLQLSFVEDTELLRSKNLFQQIPLRALYRTILSLNLHPSDAHRSMKSHALFQTLLTSMDVHVMQQLKVNYFDIFTCDRCVLEIIRLLILELCLHEQLLPDHIWSKSKLNQEGSLSAHFLSSLLRGHYSRLKPYLSELGLKQVKRSDLIYIEYLSHLVIRRSTQILSCLLACLADRYNEENLTVAIDSHLYRSCPIYQMYMQDEIQYLCKRWITMFHFVLAINKSYLGPAAVMGLQKTQKAMISQDDNISRLHLRKKQRRRADSRK